MQCYAMCKSEFHDQEFLDMKRSNGIELLKFSIEKVLEIVWKMCGNPDKLRLLPQLYF